MSAIIPLKTVVELKNADLLKQALEEMGKVLQGTGTMTLVHPMNHKAINELQFYNQNEGWIARADTWRHEKEYEAIMDEVQEKYVGAKITTEMRNRHYSVEKQKNTVLCRRV